MNVVRARRNLHGLGQDIPDIYDPGLQAAIDAPPPSSGDQYLYSGPISPAAAAAQGYPTMNAPASSSTPSSSPSFWSNLPAATSALAPGLPPGPSPRVAVPVTSGLSSLFSSTSSSSSWLLLAAAAAAVVLLAGSGKRR